MATVYPDGNGVSYTYDSLGNMTAVYPAVSTITSSGEIGYQTTANSTAVSYDYDELDQRLETITAGTTQYRFDYDVFGNTTDIDVGEDYALVDYEYNANNGKLNTLTYGNGKIVKYIYDELDRLKEIRYNNGIDGAFETAYSYSYDGNGNLSKMVDHIRSEATVYGYDVAGNLTDSYVYDTVNDEALTSNRYVYDEQQRLKNAFTRYQYSASSYMSRYFAYNTDSTLKYVSYGSAIPGKITPTYDALGRVTQRVIDFATIGSFYQTAQYTYQKSATGSWDTPYVSEYTVSIGNSASDTASDTATYRYTYDDVGNITHIHDGNNTLLYRYTYDVLGQLTREDNAPLGKTYLYTYDNAGNRLFKRTYAFTTGTPSSLQGMVRYTYGDNSWGDLLTSYGDWYIEYDEIGNPTFIYNQVDETWQPGISLIWDGRQLIGIQQSERINGEMGAVSEGTEIEYNADGIRVYMYTPNATTHYYTVDGSTILEEKIVDSYGVHYLVYVYDETGAPIAIKYSDDNTTFSYYFFEKNLQGDIVGIYNASGTQIGTYVYDAWGNVTASATAGNSSTDSWIVNNNPFRYRGYYYDIETGWYYLQTRYYNPEIGRFISADKFDVIFASPTALTDKNPYAYCDNNPVMRADEDGEFWHLLIGAAIGAVIGAVSTIATGGDFEDVLVNAVAGAASGALAASGVGLVGAVIGNATINGATYIANQIVDGEDITIDELGENVIAGAVSGFIGGPGLDGAKLGGIIKTSKNILKTAISPKKIGQYSAKLRGAYDSIFQGVLSSISATFFTTFIGMR